MELGILKEILIIFGVAIPVVFLCNLIRLPSIVGLLFTGVLAGPNGFGLVQSKHDVEILAEVGVIFLLFTIGVELSLRELWKMKSQVFIGGFLQVFLTILLFAFVMNHWGYDFNTSIFVSFLVAMSSTAIVLKSLQQRAEVDTPQGKNILSTLIFQDIVIIPLMLAVPFLAGKSENLASALVPLLLKGVAIIALTLILAIWVVPMVLYQIARTRSRELFLLSIVTIAFSVALFTGQVGLSLELGAFLAGLIISESKYSYQALAGVLPFTDIFLPFFFISIGMLLDLGFMLHHLPLTLIALLTLLVGKFLMAALSVILLGLPLRVAFLCGISLAQIGEFSFILATLGLKEGIQLGELYQLFLAVSFLSMALTPFLIAGGPKISSLLAFPFPEIFQRGLRPLVFSEKKSKSDHLVIVGFGLNGRNLAHAARAAEIPYNILEMNPVTVKEQLAQGEPIYYGDGSYQAVLGHVEIERARVMVVAISDALATRKIVSLARKLNQSLYIIARTRFVKEMEELYQRGASEVIPEEFETSVEIFTRVMRKYLVPEEKQEIFTRHIRANNYEILRKFSGEGLSKLNLGLTLPGVEIQSFTIPKESPLTGKTLGELKLRKDNGISVLALHRAGEILVNLSGETAILAGDEMIVLGKIGDMVVFSQAFFPGSDGYRPSTRRSIR